MRLVGSRPDAVSYASRWDFSPFVLMLFPISQCPVGCRPMSCVSVSRLWRCIRFCVFWRCWLGGRKGHPACKKTEWWGAGMAVFLERGADLHMAQLMPQSLTVSCFSKIQIGFAFLVPARPGSPGQRAVKWVCVLFAASCVINKEIKLYHLGHLRGGDDGNTASDDRLPLPALHQPLWDADRPLRLPDGNPDRHRGAGHIQRVSSWLERNDPPAELVRMSDMTVKSVNYRLHFDSHFNHLFSSGQLLRYGDSWKSGVKIIGGGSCCVGYDYCTQWCAHKCERFIHFLIG